MVNLSSNNSNNVRVSAGGGRNINVNSPTDNNINANNNGNSQRARSWAIGEGLIDGEDYSAKYWAEQAKISEEIARESIDAENNAHIWAEGTDEEVEAIGGTHSSKGWVDYVIENAPTASVEETEQGAVLTVTDINGTTTATIYNGADGQDGQDGAPGQDGRDGTDGADGQDGQDGFSPIATVSKSGNTATISITDANGTTTTTITDGTNGTNGIDGQDGEDGFSPTATVTKSGSVATITITDKNGTTTANVYDGTGGGGGIQNTATGTDSLTILGTPTSADYSVNIGVNSEVTGDNGIALGNYALSVDGGIAIGQNATTDGAGISIGYQCDTVGFDSIAIGYGASSIESKAIQIGPGRNTTANSFQVAAYQLLDTTTGLIPDARLSSNIARTSQIPTVPTNVSAFTNDSGYITSSALSGYATQTWVGQQGYITGITSSDVTTALGYTPYNSTNPNGYISGITSSDVTTALGYTPLNTDASNLSSTGQKVFDGVWVDQSVDLASNVSMAASASKNYSLSSYLPNDGAIYEVKFSIEGETGNSSGNGLEYRAYSDVLTSSTRGGVIAGRTRTSSTMLFASSFILPIGSGRKIYIDNSNSSSSSTLVYLRAQGYRRVGTNT